MGHGSVDVLVKNIAIRDKLDSCVFGTCGWHGDVLCFSSVIFLNIGVPGHCICPLGGILSDWLRWLYIITEPEFTKWWVATGWNIIFWCTIPLSVLAIAGRGIPVCLLLRYIWPPVLLLLLFHSSISAPLSPSPPPSPAYFATLSHPIREKNRFSYSPSPPPPLCFLIVSTISAYFVYFSE